MRITSVALLAIVMAATPSALAQQAPTSNLPAGATSVGPSPPHRGPGGRPEGRPHGPEDHGHGPEGRGPPGPDGRGPPGPHRAPHLQDLLNACETDFTSVCVGDKHPGACFVSNFSCFSSECQSAVKHAADEEMKRPDPFRRPGPPHGGHGPKGHEGDHHEAPENVKSACAADKQKLCGDVEGPGARECMRDHTSELSEVCTAAINEWKASFAPPQTVVDACTADAAKLCDNLEGHELRHCMRHHWPEVSTPCKDAIYSWKSGTTTTTAPPTTTATGSATTTVDVPTTAAPTADNHGTVAPSLAGGASASLVDPTPAILPVVLPDKCNKDALSSSDADAVTKTVDFAFSPESIDGPPPMSGRTKIAIGVGSSVSLIAVVALVVGVRRYRARRAGAAGAAAAGSVSVVENPLQYGALVDEPVSTYTAPSAPSNKAIPENAEPSMV